MTHTELARALFDAFTVGDEAAIRKLCSRDLQGSQNFGPAMGLDDLVTFTLAVQGVVDDFRYEDIVCTETDSGFVEEHLVCGRLADGGELKLAACVVAEVEDGQVVQLREYLDTLAAAPLLKALRGGA